VAALMRGDAEKILRLYKEMIGEEIEENLRQVWPVRLGEATEQLNLDWLEESGVALSRRGEVVVHPKYPWAACTLDAWCEELQCPVEAKHVGGREPLEVVIERYQPQMQWQMEISGAKQCLLTTIMGANAPLVETIDRDDAYIAEMLKRGRQFMDCVERKVPPVILPAVPAPVDASKVYDYSTNNSWCTHAADWLDTKDAGKRADEASKILKSLVPLDAKKVHGANIQITRDRAGRLSLREATQ
jgi:predicted phage-related endonuclease